MFVLPPLFPFCSLVITIANNLFSSMHTILYKYRYTRCIYEYIYIHIK